MVNDLKPLGMKVEGWSPQRAEAEYLARPAELTSAF
jgi:hypothetical protein